MSLSSEGEYEMILYYDLYLDVLNTLEYDIFNIRPPIFSCAKYWNRETIMHPASTPLHDTKGQRRKKNDLTIKKNI